MTWTGHHHVGKTDSNAAVDLTGQAAGVLPGRGLFQRTEEDRRIVLVPVRLSRVDAVRRKLAELGITEEDVKDAVAWARHHD